MMNLNSIINKYNDKEAFAADIAKQIFEREVKYHGCSQVIVQTFLDAFEEDNPVVSMAASPFAAGMAMTGNNCGALTGGLMTLGMVFGRKELNEGTEGILRGIRPMRKFIKYFESHYKHLNCRDITQIDMADPEQATAYFQAGGLEKCATMMADTGAFVAGIIYDNKECF